MLNRKLLDTAPTAYTRDRALEIATTLGESDNDWRYSVVERDWRAEDTDGDYAVRVTDEGGDCRLGTGVTPGLWNTYTNRRAIRIALEAYGATHGSHRQVRGRAIGHWTVAPER